MDGWKDGRTDRSLSLCLHKGQRYNKASENVCETIDIHNKAQCLDIGKILGPDVERSLTIQCKNFQKLFLFHKHDK